MSAKRQASRRPPGKKHTLATRRARFIVEYVRDFNATQAAIRAGYSPHSAATEGTRLLRNAQVSSLVDAELSRLTHRCHVSAERTLRHLASIAYAHEGEFVTWSTDKDGNCTLQLRDSADLTPDQLAAIQEVSEDKDGRLTVKLHPKLPALIALGRYQNIFAAAERERGKAAGKEAAEQFATLLWEFAGDKFPDPPALVDGSGAIDVTPTKPAEISAG